MSIDNKIDMSGYNPNLVETHIKMIGDYSTNRQIIELLAYIRHAIKNNLQTDIKVKIGANIANGQFAFDVNGLEISDYITKNLIEIN